MEKDTFKISLWAARVNAGLTQEEASERIGCARSSLRDWESGKTSPKARTLTELSSLYGVPVGMLKM